MTAAIDNPGSELHGRGKIDEALETLQQALDRARAGQAGPVLTADIASELAVVLKNLDRPDEAEPLYREALAIRERTFGDHRRRRRANNLGVFLNGQGRVDEAIG
ncbi:MAG: tetratricopeptide repeat protein [Vicinamibacterales bacterium]